MIFAVKRASGKTPPIEGTESREYLHPKSKDLKVSFQVNVVDLEDLLLLSDFAQDGFIVRKSEYGSNWKTKNGLSFPTYTIVLIDGSGGESA